MKINLSTDASPGFSKSVTDLSDASVTLRRHVEHTGVGGSQCRRGFGDVSDETGKIVAHVSYNGRVWGPGGYPKAPLIMEAVRS